MNASTKQRHSTYSQPKVDQRPALEAVKQHEDKKPNYFARRVGAVALSILALAGVAKGATVGYQTIKDATAIEQTSPAEVTLLEQGPEILKPFNGQVTLGEGVKVRTTPESGDGKDDKPNNVLTVVQPGTELLVKYPRFIRVDGETWMTMNYGNDDPNATDAEMAVWVAYEPIKGQTRNSDGEPFIIKEMFDPEQVYFEDNSHRSQADLVDISQG